ncbi:glutathione binding-like protein [Marinomonas transparens]|uniref:Glutathione S-transferase N-terminal domain-containing protein n=1 Tax=Marinomonas transparens TaxID=2795388 RepID=A0A934JU11_9GAMM|nr:glutathione binding-like protein [Marinomonas transparens]MBJ7539943.1 glutathione S-transferase N-terminal domain-containing protein [Marinomonas transparens]
MTSNWFPKRWPALHPDHIQLYSLATPNGQKIGIALEEMGLSYDAHLIDITAGDQNDEDYRRLSPNGKIPTLSDPNGPHGEQIFLMETGAILLYLAEKTGQLLPTDPRERIECMQWLFFQAAHVGPMFGQFGHFLKLPAEKSTDDYAKQRYLNESKRLLAVLDKRLEGRDFIMGKDYSVADIAMCPWIECVDIFYGARDTLALGEFKHVMAWRSRVTSRPAYQRGIKVCAK